MTKYHTIQLTPLDVVKILIGWILNRGYISRPFQNILRRAGHGQVIHQAHHGKKARTRKKNARRALKILKKEASRKCR